MKYQKDYSTVLLVGESKMLPTVVKDLLGDLYNEDEVETLFNFSELTVSKLFLDNFDGIKFDIPKKPTYESKLLKEYDSYHDYYKKRGINEDTAKKYSLGYDSINRQITFPVRDIDRYCVGIGRRGIDKKTYRYPEGFVKPLYRSI